MSSLIREAEPLVSPVSADSPIPPANRRNIKEARGFAAKDYSCKQYQLIGSWEPLIPIRRWGGNRSRSRGLARRP